MRSCCLAQGTIPSHLRWSMMEDNVRKRIYVCACVHGCVCVCLTGCLCCTVEIDRTLQISYNEKIKIIKFKKGKKIGNLKIEFTHIFVKYLIWFKNTLKKTLLWICFHLKSHGWDKFILLLLQGNVRFVPPARGEHFRLPSPLQSLLLPQTPTYINGLMSLRPSVDKHN